MTNIKDIKKITSILWWISDENELKSFLKILFSEKEINDFTDRVEILRLLNKGDSQRKISKDVWVSITTVTRWNKIFMANEKLVKKYIK